MHHPTSWSAFFRSVGGTAPGTGSNQNSETAPAAAAAVNDDDDDLRYHAGSVASTSRSTLDDPPAYSSPSDASPSTRIMTVGRPPDSPALAGRSSPRSIGASGGPPTATTSGGWTNPFSSTSLQWQTAPAAVVDKLHVLTERKLEKAALAGRAVGLRKLVLLSNAFASRSGSGAGSTVPSPPLEIERMSGTTLDEDEEEGELDPGMADLEDEMERKRREEDWLDSMLDEMLTNEEDDDDDDGDNNNDAQAAQVGADDRTDFHRGLPHPTRHRDFYEPYVHVSIRDRQVRAIADPETSAGRSPWELSTHEASVAKSHLTNLRELGYLEPELIPLPESPDRSPPSSASSQASDDDQTTVSAPSDNVDTRSDTTHHESAATLHEGGRTAESHAEIAEEAVYRLSRLQVAAPHYASTSEPIPIDIHDSQSLLLASLGPPTPDLAYSVNSFFSNASGSPPASVHLATPSGSPAASSAYLDDGKPTRTNDDSEKALGGSSVLGDSLNRSYGEDSDGLPQMEDLDDSVTAGELAPSNWPIRAIAHDLMDANALEDLAFKSARDAPTPSQSLSSSLEMIKYEPPWQDKIAAADEFRITSGVVSDRRGIFSAPVPLKMASSTSPTLSTRQLSGLLEPALSSYTLRDPMLSDPNHDMVVKEGLIRRAALEPRINSIALPISVPIDIANALYDSVDFGIHPIRSARRIDGRRADTDALGSSSASQDSSDPFSAPPSQEKRSLAADRAPKSCPTSPRSRILSLSRLPDGIEYDSSGSLLFSSMDLYARLSASALGLHPMSSLEDPLFLEDRAANAAATPRSSLPPLLLTSSQQDTLKASRVFGHGIVDEWERRRGTQLGHSRNDSRSPSRLRVPLQPEDVEHDFDFGGS